jgi:FkbM family methyltransferase
MSESVCRTNIFITFASCFILFAIYCIFDFIVEQVNDNPTNFVLLRSTNKSIDLSSTGTNSFSTRATNNSTHFVSTKSTKFVYVDLGANTGDSVYNFFNANSSKYPKILNSLEVSKNGWIVYAFEANPRFNGQLDEMRAELESPRRQISLYKSTAAWIYNGNISFYLDTVNKGANFWGSSLDSNHPDVVASNREKITVPCVDMADLLEQFSKEDTIVVKMDIEGAEYDLLVHLIARRVLFLIDYLAIEYHNTKVGSTRRNNDIKIEIDVLNNIIQKSNVTLIGWV